MNANKVDNVVHLFGDERGPVRQVKRRGRLPRDVVKLNPRLLARAAKPEIRQQHQATPAALEVSVDVFGQLCGIPPEQRWEFCQFYQNRKRLADATKESFAVRIEADVARMNSVGPAPAKR